MMGVQGLHKLDEQLRKIMVEGSKLPFGGLSVILVGDFHQLPPVLATTLMSDVLYLKEFRLIELTAQQRAKDTAHRALVSNMRCPDSLLEALRWMARSLKELCEDDVDFANAPIIVVTNRERCTLNKICAIAFAKRHGLPVLAFRLSDGQSDEEMFYFVQGAPAAMNEKEPNTFLCNGMQTTLSSLAYHSSTVKNQVDAAVKKCRPGEVVLVPTPDTVNVLFEDQEIPVHRASHATTIDRKDVTYFRVDPGFAYTFFKVQGLTLPRIILQLNNRNLGKHSKLGMLSLAALYVSVTRVQYTSNIRIISTHGMGLDHLFSLKHPPDLVTWFNHRAGINVVETHRVGKRVAAAPNQKNKEKRKKVTKQPPLAPAPRQGTSPGPAPAQKKTTRPAAPKKNKRNRSPQSVFIGTAPAIMTVAIDTAAIGRSGIINTGNSCYQSAVMQSMLSFGEVLSALIEMRLAFPPEVFVFLESILAGNGSIAADPSDLLRLFPPQFKNRTQNDAGEFFDVIMGDVLYGTPLDTLFRFEELTKVTCGTCGNLTTTSDTAISVKVNIAKGKDMQWMINARHLTHKLAGNNGYACTACAALSGVDIKSREALRDAVKQVCVRHAPSILVVVVQRFLFYGSKLCDTVMNTDAVEYGGQRYRLRAETLHVGDTQNSGHYTAVSREGITMVEYDDHNVRTLAQGAVTRGDVYVFWYAREN